MLHDQRGTDIPNSNKNLRNFAVDIAYILMCCDGRYLQHAAVFLYSLARHNRDRRFHVVISSDEITDVIRDKFDATLAPCGNITFEISPVLGEGIADLPIHATLTKESWGRLWIEDYFPDSVKKAFYFDPDILVTGSVAELLDVDISGHLLGAVSIPGSTRTAVHGYDPRFGYFNSGVMIVNLDLWRRIAPRDALIDYTRAHPERVNDPDQDALNGCFHDRRLPLDYIWNAITPFFRAKALPQMPASEVARITRDVRLVHFNGLSKPWLFMCNHPRKADYIRMLRQTAWRDYRYPDLQPLNVVKKIVASIFGDARIGRIKLKLASLVASASRIRTPAGVASKLAVK